jgi:hypothetical protein
MHLHASIVDQLGGPSKIASYIKDKTGRAITSQGVSMWRVQGIAHWARPTIARLARESRKSKVIPDGFILGAAA